MSSDARKMIAIRIGHPSEEILETRISVLALNSLVQFNPSLIIGAVEQVKEIGAKKRSLRLEIPVMVMDLLLAQPAEGRPHLPPVLTDVTANEVLDLVAKTFNGIVAYGACRRSNGTGLVDVSFVGLDD